MSGILMAPWMVQPAFVFNKTISVDTSNYNLRTDALAAGWDGVMPLAATVTINSGIVVSANSTAQYAFDTGATFPVGSMLALVNNGHIIGMGGAGGGYTTSVLPGKDGGTALRAQAAISVTNSGTIGGGGGGGGGYPNNGGGGGGRSGRTAAAGGSGYTGGTSSGSPGTFDGPGYGGPGAGKGGEWGAAAPNVIGGGNGGAGGAAVVGNSFITWVATGTRLGAIT